MLKREHFNSGSVNFWTARLLPKSEGSVLKGQNGNSFKVTAELRKSPGTLDSKPQTGCVRFSDANSELRQPTIARKGKSAVYDEIQNGPLPSTASRTAHHAQTITALNANLYHLANASLTATRTYHCTDLLRRNHEHLTLQLQPPTVR